jgi:predicted Zn-dependent protease
MALGYYQKASEDYLVFLRRAPKDGKVWSYLVEAYALMKRSDLALAAINRGLATGSHWSGKLKELQMQIMMGQKITPHRPFSN